MAAVGLLPVKLLLKSINQYRMKNQECDCENNKGLKRTLRLGSF